MHKCTKLLPYMRRAIYSAWQKGQSISSLAREYKVSRPTIYKVIKYARMNVFVTFTSMNKRYQTIKWGLQRLTKKELEIAKKLANREKRLKRYERAIPGELVHLDTKRLPLLRGEAKDCRREYLFVAIDDHSRWLYADIFPDKTSYSAAIFADELRQSVPFKIQALYTDNGSEYKGSLSHPLVMLCKQHGWKQYFTQIKHPWTNGKAERVIRTLMEEWHPRTSSNHNSREHRRRYLYAYVNWYNQNRFHQTIKLTPLQSLEQFLKSVNNAC